MSRNKDGKELTIPNYSKKPTQKYWCILFMLIFFRRFLRKCFTSWVICFHKSSEYPLHWLWLLSTDFRAAVRCMLLIKDEIRDSELECLFSERWPWSDICCDFKNRVVVIKDKCCLYLGVSSWFLPLALFQHSIKVEALTFFWRTLNVT